MLTMKTIQFLFWHSNSRHFTVPTFHGFHIIVLAICVVFSILKDVFGGLRKIANKMQLKGFRKHIIQKKCKGCVSRKRCTRFSNFPVIFLTFCDFPDFSSVYDFFEFF